MAKRAVVDKGDFDITVASLEYPLEEALGFLRSEQNRKSKFSKKQAEVLLRLAELAYGLTVDVDDITAPMDF